MEERGEKREEKLIASLRLAYVQEVRNFVKDKKMSHM